MQELLQYILEGIVDHPEDVSIEIKESQPGFLDLLVSVNPEDMGKVIGKKGQTIGAIRKLLRVKAIKMGLRFQLTLLEGQKD